MDFDPTNATPATQPAQPTQPAANPLDEFLMPGDNGGQAAPAAAAPAAGTPAAPAQHTPAAPAAAQPIPFNTEDFLTTLDTRIADTVRRAIPQQPRQAPVVPEVPAAGTPAPEDPFAGENLDLTPDDEALFGNPKFRGLFDKMARRAVRDYHQRYVAPAQERVREFERSVQSADQALASRVAQTGLTAAVPDYEALMTDPDYAGFASEPVAIPSSPTPVSRGDAMNMALAAGNFAYINQQFGVLRDRRKARTAQPAAAAQAPVQPVGGAAPAGSPGASAPPPGMAALASNRTYSKTRIESKLMALASEVQRNPSNRDALKSYNELRAAYGRAAAAGTLR